MVRDAETQKKQGRAERSKQVRLDLEGQIHRAADEKALDAVVAEIKKAKRRLTDGDLAGIRELFSKRKAEFAPEAP